MDHLVSTVTLTTFAAIHAAWLTLDVRSPTLRTTYHQHAVFFLVDHLDPSEILIYTWGHYSSLENILCSLDLELPSSMFQKTTQILKVLKSIIK